MTEQRINQTITIGRSEARLVISTSHGDGKEEEEEETLREY